MTLDLGIDTSRAAQAGGYALVGVNVYNLDVASAAEQENRPVLLQTVSSALCWAGRTYLDALLASLGAEPGDDLPGSFAPAQAAATATIRATIRSLAAVPAVAPASHGSSHV